MTTSSIFTRHSQPSPAREPGAACRYKLYRALRLLGILDSTSDAFDLATAPFDAHAIATLTHFGFRTTGTQIRRVAQTGSDPKLHIARAMSRVVELMVGYPRSQPLPASAEFENSFVNAVMLSVAFERASTIAGTESEKYETAEVDKTIKVLDALLLEAADRLETQLEPVANLTATTTHWTDLATLLRGELLHPHLHTPSELDLFVAVANHCGFSFAQRIAFDGQRTNDLTLNAAAECLSRISCVRPNIYSAVVASLNQLPIIGDAGYAPLHSAIRRVGIYAARSWESQQLDPSCLTRDDATILEALGSDHEQLAKSLFFSPEWNVVKDAIKRARSRGLFDNAMRVFDSNRQVSSLDRARNDLTHRFFDAFAAVGITTSQTTAMDAPATSLGCLNLGLQLPTTQVPQPTFGAVSSMGSI